MNKEKVKNDIEALKVLFKRESVTEDGDNSLLPGASEKLTRILQRESDEQAEWSELAAKAVREYMALGKMQERQVYAYCMDFIDPTLRSESEMTGGEVQHTILDQDDLRKLGQFVARHQSDIFFGEMVYKIMDRHKMTPPQVYGNAQMRRQDFSRVTNPKCKNVTRKMVWQIIVGLNCSLDEADDLLFSAGYIRRQTRLDLTMQYFIQHENYDIVAIDMVLSEFGLKPFVHD